MKFKEIRPLIDNAKRCKLLFADSADQVNIYGGVVSVGAWADDLDVMRIGADGDAVTILLQACPLRRLTMEQARQLMQRNRALADAVIAFGQDTFYHWSHEALCGDDTEETETDIAFSTSICLPDAWNMFIDAEELYLDGLNNVRDVNNMVIYRGKGAE